MEPHASAAKKTPNKYISDPIQLFCMVKPCVNDLDNSINILSSTVLNLQTSKENVSKNYEYNFKRIFSSDFNEKQVFETVAGPLVKDMLEGRDGLLLLHGTTNVSVVNFCICTLFDSIGNQQAQKFLIKKDGMNGFQMQSEAEILADQKLEVKSKKEALEFDLEEFNPVEGYSVFVSLVEVYNNKVWDLLDPVGRSQTKMIRENFANRMYVFNAVEPEVKSAAEAMQKFLSFHESEVKGHLVFVIRLVRLVSKELQTSQLSIVQLKSSEKIANVTKASFLNNSLMVLGDCLKTLRDNALQSRDNLVPFRNNKLTLLFKRHFDGQSQITVLVHVSPTNKDNLNLLNFAKKIVNNQPKLCYESQPSSKSPLCSIEFDPEKYCKQVAEVFKGVEDRVRMENEFLERGERFRARLVRFLQENQSLPAEIRNMKALLNQNELRQEELSKRKQKLEQRNSKLRAEGEGLTEVVKSLSDAIEEKDAAIEQASRERGAIKKQFYSNMAEVKKECEQKSKKDFKEFLPKFLKQNQLLAKIEEAVQPKTEEFSPHFTSTKRCHSDSALWDMYSDEEDM